MSCRVVQSNYIVMNGQRANENQSIYQAGIKSSEFGGESSKRHAENMSYKSGQVDEDGEAKSNINIFNNLQIYL